MKTNKKRMMLQAAIMASFVAGAALFGASSASAKAVRAAMTVSAVVASRCEVSLAPQDNAREYAKVGGTGLASLSCQNGTQAQVKVGAVAAQEPKIEQPTQGR